MALAASLPLWIVAGCHDAGNPLADEPGRHASLTDHPGPQKVRHP